MNGGKNQFDPGDPFIPTPATMVTHEWMNAVQEELAETIEGLGGTLATAATDTYGQLLARLNAKFGRLDLANTWAGVQTFNALVAGNDGGNTFQLKPGAEDHTFLEFFARTASPSTRSGFFGYAAVAATKLTLANEIASGNVEILPGAGGKTTTSGNIQLTGSNPASTTAFTNELTPAHIPKVWLSFTCAVGGPVTEDAIGVASVANNDANTIIITFAQAFANAKYAVAYSKNNSAYHIKTTAKTTTTLIVSANDNTGAVIAIGSSVAVGALVIDVTINGRQ